MFHIEYKVVLFLDECLMRMFHVEYQNGNVLGSVHEYLLGSAESI